VLEDARINGIILFCCLKATLQLSVWIYGTNRLTILEQVSHMPSIVFETKSPANP